jgi:DNA-binding transcriptional regulator GbsR (MarR family)
MTREQLGETVLAVLDRPMTIKELAEVTRMAYSDASTAVSYLRRTKRIQFTGNGWAVKA